MTTSRSEERVLVAGGRGFVGSHVVRALVGAGYRPVVFGPAMAGDRLADLAGRYEAVEGSVGERSALDAAFAAHRPGLVVSCVAHGTGRLGLMRSGEADAEAAFAVNVAGHGTLIEAARAAGVRRIVWTSSTVVYGPADDDDGPADEDVPLAPTTVYGLTKQMAEALSAFLARRHGLDIVALRLPLVLGHGLWYEGAASALGALFSAARDGREARIAFHDHAIDLMHVVDVAGAVLATLRHEGALARVYNLKGFEARAADLLAEIRRARPDSRLALDPVAPALLFPLIDGGRFAAATGFVPAYDTARLVHDLLESGGTHE